MGELLDTLRRINGFWAGVALLVLFAVAAAAAGLLQHRLTRRLAASPGSRVPWLALEIWFSLPGLLWLPVHGMRTLPRLLRKRKGQAPTEEAGVPAPATEALLVATLGPSFLLSGLAMAALHLLALASEPLLRSRLGLSPGYPAWQYLFLGWREELAWYIPLGRFPFLAGLLAALFWLSLWWWGSRLIRFAAIGHLGRNLTAEREAPEPLGLWRTGCGAGFLAAPDASYRRWAGWLVATGAALLAVAWLSLGGRPYRVEPSHFAVAAVLWLSWAIHLRLRGLDRPAASPEPAAPEPEAVAAGWPELAAYLREHLQVAVPPPFETPRRIEPLPLVEADPASESVLSPLLVEVLPAPRRLTTFQRAVLADLSLQGFVHLDPPPAAGELTLAGLAGEAVEDRSGLRSRNLLVIAPEGSGKSTLALLAAANHALVHTRATLVVTRDDEDEERVDTAFRGALEPSTLRFSVRVRRFGEDLMADLAQGILPDVVICSLHHLTVGVLEAPETFAPFLRNLGLVVVDDVEEFAGPVEIHAQLAFRRLTLRLRRLTGVRELGERSAPQMLILAGDSMHDLAAWARALCGVDASVRRFTLAAGEGGSHHHLFFRLADFRTAAGTRFGAAELIEACERLEVPWHYRSCGDGRRRLGRAKLPLREEPRCFRPSPEDACVILLEGPWSAVRRERDRLRRAGARFRRHRFGPVDAAAPEPVAFLTLADPDEETAFARPGERPGLANALETLPWPVVRPPSGQTVESHLAAELTRSWLETAEVIEVFGGEAAVHLRRLAAAGFLLSEERIEVDPRANRYQRELYVRALAGATAEESGVLPGKVVQVERVSARSVAVRDRTRLTVLARVDADVAGLLYYPGRIFADARGTFVVVGQEADVLVDPLLTDDLSSPRRLLFSEPEGPAFQGPDPVLFGRHPIGVSLLPVTVSVLHLATFRLAPGSRAVRQRIVIEPPRRVRTPPFATVALALHPNPGEAPEGAPVLTLREARLLAATLRAVLPSLVRGAEDGLAVALRVAAGDPAPDHPLGPEDGLFLFDLDTGGNGIARALHRDGIELLLRLVRLMVERVSDPGGLLRLHDHWADEREILAEEPEAPEGADDALVQCLLSWLDSRLRPEELS